MSWNLLSFFAVSFIGVSSILSHDFNRILPFMLRIYCRWVPLMGGRQRGGKGNERETGNGLWDTGTGVMAVL